MSLGPERVVVVGAELMGDAHLGTISSQGDK